MNNGRETVIKVFAFVVLILLVLSLVGYISSRERPSIYYNRVILALDDIYDNIKKYIDNSNGIISGNLKLNTNEIKNIEEKYYQNELFNALSGNNLDLTFDIDSNNKILLTDYITNYSNEDSINIKVNYQDYYKYAYVEDNYDKYVKKSIKKNLFDNMFETLKLDSNYLKIAEGMFDFIKTSTSQIYSYFEEDYEVGEDVIKFKVISVQFNKELVSNLEDNKNIILNSNEFKKAYFLKFNKEFDYDKFLGELLGNNVEIKFYLDEKGDKFNGIELLTTTNEITNRYMIYTKNYKDYIIDCFIDGFIVKGKFTIDKNIKLNLEIPVYDIDNLDIKLTFELYDKEKIEKIAITDYYDFAEVIFDKEIIVYKNMMKRREMRNLKYFVDLYNIDIP